jgi:hypothetical protein
MLAVRLWHAWIAFPLMAGAVGVTIALVGGYIKKVVRPKYPR